MLSKRELNRIAAAERKAIVGLGFDGASIARDFEKMLQERQDEQPVSEVDVFEPPKPAVTARAYRAGRHLVNEFTEHSLAITGVALLAGFVALKQHAFRQVLKVRD